MVKSLFILKCPNCGYALPEAWKFRAPWGMKVAELINVPCANCSHSYRLSDWIKEEEGEKGKNNIW